MVFPELGRTCATLKFIKKDPFGGFMFRVDEPEALIKAAKSKLYSWIYEAPDGTKFLKSKVVDREPKPGEVARYEVTFFEWEMDNKSGVRAELHRLGSSN